MCFEKREEDKTTSRLAKSVIASENIVGNNNITSSVKIENGIAK